MTRNETEKLREYAKHIKHHITPLSVDELERMADLVLELIHTYETAWNDPDYFE